jgi:hypothetical protein
VMSNCSSNRILVARWSISNRLIIVTLVLLRSQAVLHLLAPEQQGGESAPFAALEDDACPPPHALSPHQLR